MIPLSVLREYVPKLKDEDLKELGPVEYDQSKVPEVSKNHAENVRRKVYLPDMTESFARGVEYAGLIASEAINKASNADLLSKDTQNRFDDQIAGTTNSDEVISARRPFGAEESFPTIGSRMDSTDNKTGRVNVRDFGATGDGQSDDTDAIINAINFAIETAKELFFPNGDYVWTRPIKVTKHIRMVGESRDSTKLSYEPIVDSVENGFESRAFNGRNFTFEMVNFTVKTTSTLAESVWFTGRSSDGNTLEWGNRVLIRNVQFNDYPKYALTVVSPYEVDIDRITAEVPKGVQVQGDRVPRNNSTGILFTGKYEDLNTMGNVVKVTNSYFTHNKFGVELVNIQRANIAAVFEHNWLGAYMHTVDTEIYNTSDIDFSGSWFEDTAGGHPEAYLMDCYIDETTGIFDTTRERATNIKVGNAYVHPVKPIGLPVSRGYVSRGRIFSQDDATNHYLFRQWDSLEDVDATSVPHDGVVTQIGGNDNYFRGKIKTAGGLITQPFGTPLRSEVNGKYEYLDYFRKNFESKLNQTEQVVVHKRNSLHFPNEIPSGKVVTRIFKITAYLVMQEYNVSVLQSVYGSIGPNSVDAQTILASNPNDMLRKKDVNNPEDNNNLGIRVSENDDYLLIWFSGVGLRGVQYMIESTYYIHDGTYGF